MKSGSKDKYRSLCLAEASIPVFSRDWWLDVVCGIDKWDVLLYEEQGRIRAAMPLYLPLPKVISMPPYTQTMGVWFAAESQDTKCATAIGRRHDICRDFIGELDKYRSFLQNFHHEVTDWLPFYWADYRQTTRYTYLLDDIPNTETLWENMSAHARRKIIKATRKFNISVRTGVPTDDFLRVCSLTFARQQKEQVHTDVLLRLITVCRERGQGDIWGGYDESGQLHAVAFIVWQDSGAWYMAGGAEPSMRYSGAHSLVLWEAIQAVAAYTTRFDFEGSMLPGVERFFREFGAVQTPYFTISKGKISLWDRALIKYLRLIK